MGKIKEKIITIGELVSDYIWHAETEVGLDNFLNEQLSKDDYDFYKVNQLNIINFAYELLNVK